MLGGGGRQFLQPRELALGGFAGVLGQLRRLDPLAQFVHFGLLLVLLAELVLDRFQLLAQEELALALVDLRLHLGLDLGPELDHLELAGEDLDEVAQPLGDVDLLEQLLLLLGADPQGAGDQVAERGGVVDVGDRHLQLLRQVGDLLDDLREGALDVAGQRLQLGARLADVGQLGDAGDQVGLLGDVGAEADPLGALDEDPQRAIGDFDHPGDDADDADLVEALGPGLLVLGVAGGDHRQHPVGAEDVVDELDRALLADRQRGQRVREGDSVAQRQDRQRVGERLVGADRVLRVERRVDDFEDRGALHHLRPIGTRRVVSAGVAQRQLDPQHPVLIGRAGALGVDLDLQLDDAAEGAGGNLDLLVDAALGLLHRPLADDRQVAAADLDPDLAQLDPGEVDLDHRLLRIAAVVDVDVGREAAGAAADVATAAPGVPHHLIHLPPHTSKVGE